MRPSESVAQPLTFLDRNYLSCFYVVISQSESVLSCEALRCRFPCSCCALDESAGVVG